MNYMSGKSYPVNETLKSNVKSNLIKIWISYKIFFYLYRKTRDQETSSNFNLIDVKWCMKADL